MWGDRSVCRSGSERDRVKLLLERRGAMLKVIAEVTVVKGGKWRLVVEREVAALWNSRTNRERIGPSALRVCEVGAVMSRSAKWRPR
jgi:hypothetical protein